MWFPAVKTNPKPSNQFKPQKNDSRYWIIQTCVTCGLGPFAQNGRFGKIFAKIWLAKRRFLYDCMGRFGPELEEN
jgi:hypothetical protein